MMFASAEIAHFALILAFVASLLQAMMAVIAGFNPRYLMASNKAAAQLQLAVAGLVIFSFACLIYSFIVSDFSLALVTSHSHSLKPLIYKISGTWGNHEGSLLLWIVILVIFGGLFALTSRKLPASFTLKALSTQGWITTAFLAFSLFTSNPFARLSPAPLEGRGLNPVLQDIGLAMHPPMLYLGYVGLSMAFSLAVAGLIEGRIDRDWGRWVRPWVLSAWSALTAGIALGSWWAYYELGWGGWWFWDPVENASLMPWLAATALMHSVLVVEKRGQLKSWSVLLAILAFSLSLIGTFIVRSGLLTSVHSFASDPSRGLFILGILLFAVGIPLLLYAWRGPALASRSDASLLSRDSLLIVNNFILLVATAIVILGTFYPLALEVINGTRITVGPPYFDATYNPVMAFALIGMVIGPLLAWRKQWMPHAKTTLILAGIGGGLAVLLFISSSDNISAASLAGIALLGWLAIGILADIQARLKLHQPSMIARRLSQAGIGAWGLWLGHLGMAVFLAGALGDGIGRSEAIVRAQPGDVINLHKAEIEFTEIGDILGPNYSSLRAILTVREADGTTLTLAPERRFYPAEGQSTTEAAIYPQIDGDYFAVLGDGDGQTGYSLRLYHKPFVSWIWGGALIMAIGGLFGFAGRSRLKEARHDS